MRQALLEVQSSIDNLLKAMNAIPPADRADPEWPDGTFAKRVLELRKLQDQIVGDLIVGSAAVERSDEPTKAS
jgi:hypothetical protein